MEATWRATYTLEQALQILGKRWGEATKTHIDIDAVLNGAALKEKSKSGASHDVQQVFAMYAPPAPFVGGSPYVLLIVAFTGLALFLARLYTLMPSAEGATAAADEASLLTMTAQHTAGHTAVARGLAAADTTQSSSAPLAGSCPLLKIVDLRRSKLITDASIAALKAALSDVLVYWP